MPWRISVHVIIGVSRDNQGMYCDLPNTGTPGMIKYNQELLGNVYDIKQFKIVNVKRLILNMIDV